MRPDDAPDEPDNTKPDAVTAHLDPGALKDAHGRTGRLLQGAGLPFEEEEFEGHDDSSSSSDSEDSSSSSSEEE